MKAVKIIDTIEKLPEGDLLKAIAWKVSESKDFPEGIKYAFAYIHKGKRVLGYDNERAKGHHKHVIDLKTGADIEIKVNFKDPVALFNQFKNEVHEIRKVLYGGKNESQKNRNKDNGHE